MSTNDAGADAALQFDRAELAEAPAGVTCGLCMSQVPAEYYQLNGAVACPACKDAVVAARAGGSRVARVLGALGLGLLAAALGAAIWIGIVRATGYEIGLVAIGVGLLVGAGVRKGSGGRGGWGYQALAVVLTYSAMVAYYVPFVIEGLRKGAEEQAKTEAAAAAPSPASPAVAASAATSAGGERAGARAEADPPVSAGKVALALAVVAGIAFAAPFLAGAENLIGILIILFALYEAWKLNKRQPFVVAGPFQVAPAEAASAPAPSP